MGLQIDIDHRIDFEVKKKFRAQKAHDFYDELYDYLETKDSTIVQMHLERRAEKIRT